VKWTAEEVRADIRRKIEERGWTREIQEEAWHRMSWLYLLLESEKKRVA